MSWPDYDAWLEAPYQERCREEEKNAKIIEEYDDFDGWMQWLESDTASEDFEIFCFDKHWGALKESFANNLHPTAAAELDSDPDDPMGDNWALWSLFLYLVLDQKTLEPLVAQFVELNREAFEEWCIA